MKPTSSPAQPAQHTQGPWVIIPHDTLNCSEIADSIGYERKTVALGVSPANARLISAAPELLAALEEMIFRFDHMAENSPEDAESLNQARAALAKATTP